MARPAVIAHRGFAGVAPENTVEAATRAADREETAMIEIDVQPAACGTPVVVHDERLSGSRDGRPLTDATGFVRETPLEALREARVLGTDATVPTLAELLAAVPETVGVNVELKAPGTRERRPGESLPPAECAERRAVWQPFVDRVVADCAAFGGDLLLSSFCEGAIAALRESARTRPPRCSGTTSWPASRSRAGTTARRFTRRETPFSRRPTTAGGIPTSSGTSSKWPTMRDGRSTPGRRGTGSNSTRSQRPASTGSSRTTPGYRSN